MPKRVLSETVSTHTLIEQVPDDKETSITVPDVYETYCKGNLTILRRILHLDLAKGNPK
jgi:hypothetical protein